MIPLGEEYSLKAFEDAGDATVPSARLAAELTDRMQSASVPEEEVRKIIEELRALGHDLWSWDEDEEWAAWGGNYSAPVSPYRLVLQFYYPSPPEVPDASVQVDFGPWPPQVPRTPEPACPTCSQEMAGSSLRLQGIGHGSYTSLPVRVELSFGELDPIRMSCGNRSCHFQINAHWCAGCKALWIPNVEAGRLT